MIKPLSEVIKTNSKMESATQNSDVFVPKVPSATELAEASEVDRLEYQLSQMPDGFFPTDHLFSPNMYIRRIFMPAGSLLTSMKHKTEHPFVILSGKVRVMDQEGVIEYQAPFVGITQAGTKRVLYTHEDTTWLTFHANPENIDCPDKMVEYLTMPSENKLFDKKDPRINSWEKNKYNKKEKALMNHSDKNNSNDSGGELI